MTNIIATLLHITLAKILMKGHAILTPFSSFGLHIAEPAFDTDGYRLYLVGSHGYDRVSIDLFIADTEAEIVEWLQNSRVSTRAINKIISEVEAQRDECDAIQEEVEALMVETGIQTEVVSETSFNAVTGEPNFETSIDWDAVEATPHLGDFLNYFSDGWPRAETFKELNAFKKSTYEPLVAVLREKTASS